MIVGNPCVYDTRVIKEAETLVRGGYNVTVLCQKASGVADVETRNGVEYVRVPMSVSIPSITRIARRLYHKVRISTMKHLGAIFVSIFGSPTSDGNPHSSSPWAVRDHAQEVSRLVMHWVSSLVHATAKLMRWLLVPILVVLVPIRRLVRPILVAYLRYRAIHRVAAEQVPRFRPDVIHAHDLLPLPAAIRCARRNGASVVYDSHELECHRNGLTYVARCAARFHERRNIGRAALVITVCDSIADHLADAYGISRPVVVMNAPTVTALQSDGETIRSTLGLSDNTALGIYVGKLTINRGLEQVVEALAYCADIHVALLGPRHAPTEQAVASLADKLGVRARLHILESVPPESVVSFISSADFGVIPTQDACLSYRFSLPNKLFEMTFARLPVCISDLPEQRAFVERVGNGVIMDENDPKDIARALRETYERRFELTPSKARLKSLVRDYSWDEQARRLLDAYQDLFVQARRRETAVSQD